MANVKSQAEALPFGAEHYRELRRRHIARLTITYLAPLIILIVYFQYHYCGLATDSRRLHLSAIAEHQANTLDLYLQERRINVANLLFSPRFQVPPTSRHLRENLDDLRRISQAFVDLGYFDSAGVQAVYAGPYPALELRSYRSEPWYVALKDRAEGFIITDIYLGFRQQPHFTIAVSRMVDSQFVALRATLDPSKMYDYIESQQNAGDLATSIINRAGAYQLVNQMLGQPLQTCPITIRGEDAYGVGQIASERGTRTYAYRWLRNVDWALIVHAMTDEGGVISDIQGFSILASALLVLILILVVINRAGRLVAQQKETDQARAQLEHASKLASVGELAAGIAHEINNPLAVITEESGLLMDYMEPEFRRQVTDDELRRRLKTIQQSAFRCRDIARKLLSFVRKSDFDLREHDIHEVIDGVIDGLLGPEILVSRFKVVRRYDRSLPRLSTDANQLQQVILNIVNNAADAIGDQQGTITIVTSRRDQMLVVTIQDSGCGMTNSQLEKVFLPFFTTKEVGKGTGLGLSVSYGIVRNLGGDIEVISEPGKGSSFSLVLPLKLRR